MRIRFGYVAMSLVLKECSPSKTITVRNLEKIEDNEAKINRLRRLAGENLRNCLRLLYHNAAHDIRVFRLTSKLIPLATHPMTQEWDYIADFAEELKRIGKFILENNMRISSHPDHFTLINSPKPEVLEASISDLEYHGKIFKGMGLDDAGTVIHIGGMYGSKAASVERFKVNYRKLPDSVKKRLLLENDDKSFDAADVLEICQSLKVPMVFDIHHHHCLHCGKEVPELLPEIFKTWAGKLPKVHVSSPRSPSNCRAHADDIDVDSFNEFLLQAKELDADFDVMIEAKNKDLALFNLMKKLQQIKGIEIINEAEISF